MANNPDLNYHLDIINSIYILRLNDRICVFAFRNLIRDTIRQMEHQIDHITDQNTRRNFRLKIVLYKTIENWLTTIITVQFQ